MALSYSSRASTPTFSDDEDAITPIIEAAPTPQPVSPAPTPAPALEHNSRSRTSSVGSARTDASSHQSLAFEVSEHVDAARLWQRMLALQRKYRCYTSARITAAVENDDVGAIVPSRACLDLLNDSISTMPEDIRGRVTDFIKNGEPGKRRRRRKMF